MVDPAVPNERRVRHFRRISDGNRYIAGFLPAYQPANLVGDPGKFRSYFSWKNVIRGTGEQSFQPSIGGQGIPFHFISGTNDKLA
jgi:hypothetical protein